MYGFIYRSIYVERERPHRADRSNCIFSQAATARNCGHQIHRRFIYNATLAPASLFKA